MHLPLLLLALLHHTHPTASMSAPSTSSRLARAAIAQLRSTRNKRANLLAVARCAGWAQREGAAMLFLPECLGFMGDSAANTLDMADPPIASARMGQEEVDCGERTMERTSLRRALADTIATCAATPGDDVDDVEKQCNDASAHDEPITSIVEELRFIARESNLWISGGGVHTAVPPSDLNADKERNIYNTHVIIDGHGNIQAHYHKIHLFDVSIPGKVNLQESKTTSPGTELVVCDSPVGKLGVTICYDVRFPEQYVELVARGAEVLLVPSAFTVPTGKAHWHALLKARAIESQCYVLAAAQVGQHNEKRQSYGHTVAYDPWGDLLADAGGYDGTGTSGTVASRTDESPVRAPSIVIADIDLDEVASVRERMPIQRHRGNASFSN